MILGSLSDMDDQRSFVESMIPQLNAKDKALFTKELKKVYSSLEKMMKCAAKIDT